MGAGGWGLRPGAPQDLWITTWNWQAGRTAMEVVTRLLMPSVLRVPCRRPHVKARNLGVSSMYCRPEAIQVSRGKLLSYRM